ncbi:Lin1244/Lin1753 domain-containing protein [Parabacteroides sp. AM08-6]|uniref:Lin1244/Lin1753 domain-containing protein n=1 Tax=Parabacteroides sp. AM08-6 TaxID=2292053 RepID=UPI000EFF7954|nr:Lin1244/Lin1753 domain-containing protein [Parabacteroides sp. AM08-6]RHJ78086.1 DUF4373 domain-containing protein [Parabacteroides sp. AM08-6]
MSRKETFYFSHDADAMNDPKCMLLISQLGMEGYGAFWGLVELLRVQPEYKMSIELIPAIAARFQMSEAKLKTVISSFGLFHVTEDYFFYSQSLRDRMQLMLDKKKQQILAGIKSGEVRRMKALAATDVVANKEGTTFERPSNDLRTNKIKESKYKKESIKKKAKAFNPPELFEVEEYCKQRNNNVDASRWWNFYQSKGWMVGKNKMKDWKAAVITWEKEDKEKQHNNQSHESSKQYTKL